MTHQNTTKVIAEAGKQEIFITREFDAVTELVFRAHVDAELLKQWYLIPEGKMGIDYMDMRTHGAYRFLVPDQNGNQTAISGVVHECMENVRIIRTFEYEGLPERGHLALQKVLFEDLPNERCKVTTHYICESVDYRDGMVNSGMEIHTNSLNVSLDALLAKLK